MSGTHVELLHSFLVDAADPRWSSYALDRMFAKVDRDPKQGLLKLLPLIDDRLLSSSRLLTMQQIHFLRDVILRVYAASTPVVFTPEDISWLIDRFRSVETPQRALMIGLLVRLDELPEDIDSTILSLLRGTPAYRYVAAALPDDTNPT